MFVPRIVLVLESSERERGLGEVIIFVRSFLMRLAIETKLCVVSIRRKVNRLIDRLAQSQCRFEESIGFL